MIALFVREDVAPPIWHERVLRPLSFHRIAVRTAVVWHVPALLGSFSPIPPTTLHSRQDEVALTSLTRNR